eukprot:862259-Karenia_brevis.AAC.1
MRSRYSSGSKGLDWSLLRSVVLACSSCCGHCCPAAMMLYIVAKPSNSSSGRSLKSLGAQPSRPPAEGL